jgi:hypothetical protein
MFLWARYMPFSFKPTHALLVPLSSLPLPQPGHGRAPPTGRGQHARSALCGVLTAGPPPPSICRLPTAPFKRVPPPDFSVPAPPCHFRSDAPPTATSPPPLVAGPPPKAADDRRSRPPPERRHPEPISPPRRSAAGSVHPCQFRLARHLPLFPRELSPLNSLHLVTRLDAAGRAHGHRVVPMGGASAPRRTRANRAEWLLARAAGRRATARGPV